MLSITHKYTTAFTSVKSVMVKLVSAGPSPPFNDVLSTCELISTLTYNRVNNVVMESALILNILNIFKYVRENIRCKN